MLNYGCFVSDRQIYFGRSAPIEKYVGVLEYLGPRRVDAPVRGTSLCQY